MNVGSSLPVRVMSRMGMYSYGIYLWHVMVDMWFLHPAATHFSWPWPGYAIAYFAATVGVGVVTTTAIEMPSLWLRDRLFPTS